MYLSYISDLIENQLNLIVNSAKSKATGYCIKKVTGELFVNIRDSPTTLAKI